MIILAQAMAAGFLFKHGAWVRGESMYLCEELSNL